MSEQPTISRRARDAARRLFDALDRHARTGREVERARAALDRATERRLRLCGVPDERRESEAG